MTASDSSPALTITMSALTPTTMPVRMAPVLIFCPAKLSSSICANDSLMIPSVIRLASSTSGLIQRTAASCPRLPFGSSWYDAHTFEPVQNVGHDFLGRQTRRVDDVRIRCRLERRHRAVRVARVPLRYVPGKVGQANINPLFFQLLMTPHRTRLGAGRQHHLQ